MAFAFALAVGMACPAGERADRPRPAPAEESKPGWPESWGAKFGLRCASAGEDVRVCTCVASEVQKKWTPEQFKALGHEPLDAQRRVCRERVGVERAK